MVWPVKCISKFRVKGISFLMQMAMPPPLSEVLSFLIILKFCREKDLLGDLLGCLEKDDYVVIN